MSACPICGGAGRPLLALRRQPIYQHPVAADVEVPEPHAVDLDWASCQNCAHAWQPAFDAELLAGIYRSYYYTPAPDGIGVQFRDDFLTALEHFGLSGGRRVLLEIGASSGDVLAALVERTGAMHAYAFEPNSENAVVARRRGLDVREKFFTSAVAGEGLEPANLIYARHVIEHIFDFADFFAGLNAVSAPAAQLVLETPSLDFHAERGSTDPFHIEHIHVFALRSLAHLGSKHGWGFQRSLVSSSGNLIAVFGKGAPPMDVAAPALEGLQRAADTRLARLQQIFAGRQLVFWGAGSAGVVLARTLEREPELWTDGNPAKVGKHFIGFERRIVSPEDAVAAAKSWQLCKPALVITSSFLVEILPRVRQLGWKGDVFDTAGNLL